MLITAEKTHADYCSVTLEKTQYQKIYCQMEMGGNDDVNEEIIETIADQYQVDKAFIGPVLNGEICQTIANLPGQEEAKKLPKSFLTACQPKDAGIEEQFTAQNTFSDIQNSYEKEKAMFFSKTALKQKFKMSEVFWDGKVGGPLDPPFDLMTDLNLIDKVLFGSRAEWFNDVYGFHEKIGEKADEVLLDELLENEEQDLVENEKIDEEGKIECVPINHPDAQNTLPQSLFCGNGTIDVLTNEACDDGNLNSGDGCNQFCQLELGGGNQQCLDPDAITFKEPSQAADELNACEPGTVPKKKTAEKETQDATQLDNYPGPNIGGTLKQFPESERPACGPGESALEIKVAGETKLATDSNGNARCVPTEICSDPDIARSFFAATTFPFPINGIAAAEWQELPDDNAVKKSLEAIEALYCVNVIKNNRPLSPYAMNEGCIDCHITAMTDKLEESLTTNVTPFENTTSAFGLSSRFGPTFSFNLITTLKPKLKLTPQAPSAEAIEESNASIEGFEEDLNMPEPNSIVNDTNQERLTRIRNRNNESISSLKEAITEYRLTTELISDVKFSSQVTPLIVQMRQSFESIQSKFQDMVLTTELDKTPLCKI